MPIDPKKMLTEFEGWSLMPVDKLVWIWTEIGTISLEYAGETREWVTGRSESSAVIYLFTDLPHPKSADISAVFQMDTSKHFEPFAQALMESMIDDG